MLQFKENIKLKSKLNSIFILITMMSLLAIPAQCNDNDIKHRCDAQCHEHYNGHRCDKRCDDGKHYEHSCDQRCHPLACTVTNIITKIVTLTNTVVDTQTIIQTNYVIKTLTNTITETVTNVVSCPSVDLAVTDYKLTGLHIYRLIVSSDTTSWKNWATIRATSNQTARVVIPLATIKPLYWQIIDITPGYPRNAVLPTAPTCINAVTYIALSQGRFYRVPAGARP